MLATENYRQTVAASVGLGSTESLALVCLAAHGDHGQSDLARALRLTSSASTALVDRLERQGVAERKRHPHDRRRAIVGLTERGEAIASESALILRQSLEGADLAHLTSLSAALASIAEKLGAVTQRVATGAVEPMSTRALPTA